MAAILGLRGTGTFTTDERPKNWRESILYLFPSGEAPLTAVSSYLKNEGTDDPEYNWWEKRLPTQQMQVNGTIAGGVTTLVVDSGAKDAVAGTILQHESTGELVRVTTTPTDDVTLLIERSWGSVAAGTITDNDKMIVIGNVHSEGDEPPSARAYAPTKKTNFTQIWRTSLYLTRTARRTKLRWDNQGPFREARREALSLHSIEMEKSAIFGQDVESTGANGQPMRSTAGILDFLTTNAAAANSGVVASNYSGGAYQGTNSAWAINGLLSEDVWDLRLEELFRYGSNEKLCLAGSTFINAINTLGKRNGTLEMTPKSTTYGMKLVTYTTPYGDIHIKNHPLFSQHPSWRKNALFLDLKHVHCRPLDDTRYITNRQTNGEDARMDEYLTELGFEWWYEETHAYMTGVDGAMIA